MDLLAACADLPPATGAAKATAGAVARMSGDAGEVMMLLCVAALEVVANVVAGAQLIVEWCDASSPRLRFPATRRYNERCPAVV